MGFFTYLDRNNLAFAAFQFKADLHLSNSTYGLGKFHVLPPAHDSNTCQLTLQPCAEPLSDMSRPSLQEQACFLWGIVRARYPAMSSCGEPETTTPTS